ncbi:hypothetical protein BC828DRAFT_291670 [Blastocladiella britannica]|nr:hypothetical protein BC828DRAFT_291670 [Blastocladiella britannica]
MRSFFQVQDIMRDVFGTDKPTHIKAMLVLPDLPLRFSCDACIRGHRTSTCAHADRELFEIRKKGRPSASASARAAAAIPPAIAVPTVLHRDTGNNNNNTGGGLGQKVTMLSAESAEVAAAAFARGVTWEYLDASTKAAKGKRAPRGVAAPVPPSTSSESLPPAASSSLPSSSESVQPEQTVQPEEPSPRTQTIGAISAVPSPKPTGGCCGGSRASADPEPPASSLAAVSLSSPGFSLDALLNPCTCFSKTGVRCLCCTATDNPTAPTPTGCSSMDCACAHSVLGSLGMLLAPSSASSAGFITAPSPAPPRPIPITSVFLAAGQALPYALPIPASLQSPITTGLFPVESLPPLPFPLTSMSDLGAVGADSLPSSVWSTLPAIALGLPTPSTSPPETITVGSSCCTKKTPAPAPPAAGSCCAKPTSPTQSSCCSTTPNAMMAVSVPSTSSCCGPTTAAGGETASGCCSSESGCTCGPSCCSGGEMEAPISPPLPPVPAPEQCCCSAGGPTSSSSSCGDCAISCPCSASTSCGGQCCARAKKRTRRDMEDRPLCMGLSHGDEEDGNGRARKVRVVVRGDGATSATGTRAAVCTCGCVKPARDCGDCSKDVCVDRFFVGWDPAAAIASAAAAPAASSSAGQ